MTRQQWRRACGRAALARCWRRSGRSCSCWSTKGRTGHRPPHFEERLFQVVVHGSLVIYFIRDDGARYSLSSGEADYILGDMDLFLPSTGSIYTEAAEPLLCLALSLDQNREALLASNSFLRLICGSLTAKMAAITALDAAPGSLTDRVLSYMRFKCQGGVFRGLEREAFHLHCSARQLQRIINQLAAEGKVVQTGKKRPSPAPLTAKGQESLPSPALQTKKIAANAVRSR